MSSEKTKETIASLRAQKVERQKELGQPLSTYDMLGRAVQNIPKSTIKYAEDLVTPILDPVGTATGLYSFTSGLVQLALPGEQPDEKTVKAVGDYFSNRYGSLAAFKAAFADDPVGVVGDISMVITGPAGLSARLPGSLGNISQKVSDIGSAIDPLNVAAQSGKALKTGLTEGVPSVVGMTTGAGKESIQTAYDAGRAGGAVDQRFVDNMRGVEDPGAVVEDATSALRTLRNQRNNDFVTSKQALELEKQRIDFDSLSSEFDEWGRGFDFEFDQGTPGYQVERGAVTELSKAGQAKLQEIQRLIKDWSQSPALHNAKGLDILKRRIDNEYPTGINPGDSAVVVAQARDMIKRKILEEVPDYAAVMKPYEEAVRLEREMQRALSLNNAASADTALRKLQSVMRNNVNANFGSRLRLVEKLEEAGDYYLLPRIAGQSLSSPAPRGLQALTATGTGIAGLSTNPATLATLPAFSPRLMGELSRQVGKVRGGIDAGIGAVKDRMPSLSPEQQAIINQIPELRRFQVPAQVSRLGGAIMNEPVNQAMTQEEFDRLRSLSQDQQILMQ